MESFFSVYYIHLKGEVGTSNCGGDGVTHTRGESLSEGFSSRFPFIIVLSPPSTVCGGFGFSSPNSRGHYSTGTVLRYVSLEVEAP